MEMETDLPNEAIDTKPDEIIPCDLQQQQQQQQQQQSMETELATDDDAKDDPFRSVATFSFTVDYFEEIEGNLFSPPVYARMLPWRMMIVPSFHTLGLFVQCNAGNYSDSWSCFARFELRLKCHKPGLPDFVRFENTGHIFCAKENDYGFCNFISWQMLNDPDSFYIFNNSITLEAHVIADVPHGVFWDSKKHAGYVGLQNQGATCYMNSLLQTLYFTNSMRLAVYRMPTEADDSSKSVGLSLQKIFHELQFSDLSVCTKNLTNSFGWQTFDSLLQHDVQEFLRVLLEKLESKMAHTVLEDIIPNLFKGTMSSYIKCKNVDFCSTHEEAFYDIQVNIKDKANIYESFQDYVASETLEGDNKYHAGVYGLQEASKGVIFKKLPKVLHLHLMRFQYDIITESSIKCNDRFEFYEKISLDSYLAKPEETPADYVLHAVLVHSGDNRGGHYVVFINPKADGQWFKFDDDVVSRCQKYEAIEQNYGGTANKFSHCSNAYMLVYIRCSELKSVLGEISENDIPSELVERLDLEKRIEMARCKERSEEFLHVSINVILEEYFEGVQTRRLFDLEKVHLRKFRMNQNQTVSEMVAMFVKNFGVHRDRMRIWNYNIQKFKYFDFDAKCHCTIAQITNSKKSWFIFLELAKPGTIGPLLPFHPENDVLLFIKYYDARNKRLCYMGCTQQPRGRSLVELVPEVNRKLGFSRNTEFSIFDEYADKKVDNVHEPIESALYLPQDDLQGHVLIFERMNVDNKLELPTVEDYFTDLVNRVEIIFSDKCNINENDFTLKLSNRNNYGQMANAVAERLNYDFQKLQFYMCISKFKETPGNAVPYTFKGTIEDLLSYNTQSKQKKIFYERLPLRVHELTNKIPFKCIWVSNDLNEDREIVLYIDETDTVKNLLEQLEKKITFAKNSSKRLRLLKITNHMITSICKDDALVKSLLSIITNMPEEKTSFRIEEVPADEAELAGNEILRPIAHFTEEPYNPFGVPFLIKVRQGEPYTALEQRIQNRLNLPDKEWESYKFVAYNLQQTMETIDLTVVNLDGDRIMFGLVHNKTRKRTLLKSAEKAIKIFN